MVPEGYFWRVYWNQDHDSVWIRVSVSLNETLPPKWYNKNRSKRVGIAYTRIENIYSVYTREADMFDISELQPKIVKLAETVLITEAKEIQFTAMRKQLRIELDKLSGDYPPKTLKDN